MSENGIGYRRGYVTGLYLRAVTDRVAAIAYLSVAWPSLPASFFDWLRGGPDGTTYLLLPSPASQRELWVLPTSAQETASEPLPALIGAVR